MDWPGLYIRFRPRIEQAQATGDARAYYRALLEYVNAIPDGHIGLDAENSAVPTALGKDLAGGGFGLAVAEVDVAIDRDPTPTPDRRRTLIPVVRSRTIAAAVAVIPFGPAALAGIVAGAQIITWGGQPAKTVIGRIDPGVFPLKALTGPLGSISPQATLEHARLEQTRLLMRAPVGTRVQVAFKNPGSERPQTAVHTAVDDAGQSFSLLTFAKRAEFLDPVEYRILPEGYGYVLVRMELDLSNPDDPTRIYLAFQQAIASFVAAGVPGVIVDLRGNLGGSDGLAAAMCGFFYAAPVFYEYQEYYDKRTGQFLRLTVNAFNAVVDRLSIDPQAPYFGGPVVALVNPATISSGEGVALCISRRSNGTVIGFHGTNGSFGMSGGEIGMPGGYTIKYPYGRSVDEHGGVQLDSRNGIGGVAPNPRVPNTLGNVLAFAAGTDVEFQSAVTYLNDRTRKVGTAMAAVSTPIAGPNRADDGAFGTGTLPSDDDRVHITATTPHAIRMWDSGIDRLVRDGALVLVRREADTLIAGRSHERLQQYYKGVPIVGAEVTRQVAGGQTASIFGTLHVAIDLDTEPAVRAEDAQVAAARHAGLRNASVGRPILMVLPTGSGRYALAWQAEVRAATDVRVCFVDAATGHALFDYSNLKTQQPAAGLGRGVLGDTKTLGVSTMAGVAAAVDRRHPSTITTFDLRGDHLRTAGAVRGSTVLAPADIAVAASTAWTDGAVVDAHAYASATVDYYLRQFNRRGLDGRDGPVTAVVHPVKRDAWSRLRSSYSLYFTSSFWDGHMAVFGEGVPPGDSVAGRTWTYLSAAADIVAHELTHGVTDASSNLIYVNESGALNEAFSDIMATAIEFHLQPAGSGPLKADYLVGEDAVSGGIRSLDHPASKGHPDHYSNRYMGTADNGGVHANSTIASHAYYLAVDGGTNRTSGLPVTGVGSANRTRIDAVFFRAFVYVLPSSADFSSARAATIQSARDLYGNGSAVERAVTQAWAAVGVR